MLILCTLQAAAQKNYVPAIIITPESDSLRGLVDYRNWRKAPESIHFRKDLSAAEQTFTPLDIRGFLILPANELYVSRPVKLDITDESIDRLLATDEREHLEDTVFLLNIVQGVYNLYVYMDEHDRYHYVYDAEGQPVQELQVLRKKAPGSSSAILTLNHYQQQLYLLFGDCPSIAKRASRASYRENNLRELFAAYHRCRQPSTALTIKQTEKSSVRWGVLAGFSANTIRFTGDHPLARMPYTSSASVLPGLFLDIPCSRQRQQYWLGAELYYKTQDASGERIGARGQPVEQVDLKFTYLQLNVMFRYVYPKGRVRPFVNVGWGNAVVLSENENKRFREGYRDSEAIDGPRKHEGSIFGGLGVQYGRFQVEARHARTNGFSPYNALGTGIRSWQGVVRVRI
ncbi:outer membrane protein with beta-barrel domain [Chitinophaga japonensis]|uniref:Outer membrane protein with beta-barrel domain n=1 Tax=Chitinophaga japonensis TaxID=104662 RepID=A0A562TFH3_CHIJA|nr:outer membrane protein with beta-barrel domain [Chitinophaga japonensis]